MDTYQKFAVWLEHKTITEIATGKAGVKAVIVPDPQRPLFRNGGGISLRGKTSDGRAIETSPIAEFVNMAKSGVPGTWALKTLSNNVYHVTMDDILAKKIVGTFYKNKGPATTPTAPTAPTAPVAPTAPAAQQGNIPIA